MGSIWRCFRKWLSQSWSQSWIHMNITCVRQYVRSSIMTRRPGRRKSWESGGCSLPSLACSLCQSSSRGIHRICVHSICTWHPKSHFRRVTFSIVPRYHRSFYGHWVFSMERKYFKAKFLFWKFISFPRVWTSLLMSILECLLLSDDTVAKLPLYHGSVETKLFVEMSYAMWANPLLGIRWR